MAEITKDSERISRGNELNQIEAGITASLTRLSQYSSQLDAIKAAMTDPVYTTQDKNQVDRIKLIITNALS